ncbi:hypothetical protein [Marinobacter similis]|nr:hypothetical protein [Marinobacter similis]
MTQFGLMDEPVEEAPRVPTMSQAEAQTPTVPGNPLSAPMYSEGGYASRLRAQTAQAQGYEKLRDKFGDVDGNLQVLPMAAKLQPFRSVDLDNLFADEEEDPNFNLKSDEVKALIKDMPRDYQEKFFREDPVNMAMAQRIATNLNQERELMTEYASAGIGTLLQAEMAAMLLDPVFLGSTVVTLGAGSAINASVKTLQLSRNAYKTAKAMEYLGLPMAEAAGYNALVAKTQDSYNGHDALIDTAIAGALIGPLGGMGLRSATKSLDLTTMAKGDLADALLEDVAVASQKAVEVEVAASVKPVIRELSYEDMVGDVKAGLTARAGNKNDRATSKALVAEERMLLDQIDQLQAQKDALMANQKGRTTGKVEEVASFNSRIETLTASLDRVKTKLGRDVEASKAESELSRVEDWVRREASVNELQDGKVALQLKLEKVAGEAQRSKGKAKKNAKEIGELQGQVAKLDAEIARLTKMDMPSSLKDVEAEMQNRLAKQSEVVTESPDIASEAVEELSPLQQSAVDVLEDTSLTVSKSRGCCATTTGAKPRSHPPRFSVTGATS